MSRYTVYNLVVDVTRKIHGGGIDDFQSCLDEGRRNMLEMIQPGEMSRKAFMEQALYDQVDKYAVPEDMDYDNLQQIKMVSSYRNVDTLDSPLELVYRRYYDQKRHDSRNIISIFYENGVKYAGITHPRGLKECQHLLVNDVNSLTANGTWNVGGNVVNLRLDELNHITGHASLSFDINDSDTFGFIENSSMKPIDMSDYLNVGAAFVWANIPIPENLVAVKLILGSNVTDHTTDTYSSTVGHPHDNNEFTTMWNLLKYMLNNLAVTGFPNPKSIGFMRVEFTTTGEGIPNCNIDNVVIRKGTVYEMVYDSEYCLIDAVTGAWKQRTTSNSDIVPLETDSYQILMLETALVAQKDLYANNFGASTDVAGIEGDLAKAYSKYAVNHTDESIEPTEDTYILGDFMSGYSAPSLGGNGERSYGDEPRVGGNSGNDIGSN